MSRPTYIVNDNDPCGFSDPVYMVTYQDRNHETIVATVVTGESEVSELAESPDHVIIQVVRARADGRIVPARVTIRVTVTDQPAEIQLGQARHQGRAVPLRQREGQ